MFSKKTNRNREREEKPNPVLAQFVANRMIFRQKTANWVTGKTNRLSPVQLKLIVVLCCISISGISTCIIWEALFAKTNFSGGIMVRPIPALPAIGKNKNPEPFQGVSPADHLRLLHVRKFMDSLADHNRPEYFNLIKQRPHLLDSIDLLESIYKQQSKK